VGSQELAVRIPSGARSSRARNPGRGWLQACSLEVGAIRQDIAVVGRTRGQVLVDALRLLVGPMESEHTSVVSALFAGARSFRASHPIRCFGAGTGPLALAAEGAASEEYRIP
jgi:hypothetical protein